MSIRYVWLVALVPLLLLVTGCADTSPVTTTLTTDSVTSTSLPPSTPTSGGHTSGTPYFQSDGREWSPIDALPEDTLQALTSDLETHGLRLLVPTTPGPAMDRSVGAQAWVYWLPVSGESGANLMLIAPESNSYHLQLHLTTDLSSSRGSDFVDISIRGFQGQQWVLPPSGYPFPQTVFIWVENNSRITVSVNENLLDRQQVLDWLNEWTWIP